GEESGAVEKGVQVAATGDIDAGDAFDLRERAGNFLGDLPGSFLQALGQLEAYGRGSFAQFQFGRPVERYGELDAVLFFDVSGQRFAQAMQKSEIHRTSVSWNQQPGKFQYNSRVARASEMRVWVRMLGRRRHGKNTAGVLDGSGGGFGGSGGRSGGCGVRAGAGSGTTNAGHATACGGTSRVWHEPGRGAAGFGEHICGRAEAGPGGDEQSATGAGCCE